MGRKTTWKEIHIRSAHNLQMLQSSASSDFDGYTIVYENGISILETNMPHDLLRRWFSFADVPLPKDFLTADKPSWELYAECQNCKHLGMIIGAEGKKHWLTCDECGHRQRYEES